MAKHPTFKRQSGIKESAWSKYDFSDISYQSPQQQLMHDLSWICVKTNKEYYFKDLNKNNWYSVANQHAEREAINKWIHVKKITSDDIHQFFTGDYYVDGIDEKGKKVRMKRKGESTPLITGQMLMPMTEEFIYYSNNRYLNVWNDNMIIEGDDTYLKQYGYLILRMIYRSLCNGEQLHQDPRTEAEMIWEQITTNNYINDDFRFVMIWLALIIQRPGWRHLTNLWFCGNSEGIGKGTLIELMKLIMPTLVGKADQQEIAKNWTTSITNKLLIEVDEFNSNVGGKTANYDWNNWLKIITAPTIAHVGKNENGFPMYNVGNFIFSTNNENPVNISSANRRDQFIKTTDDVMYWRAWATSVNNQIASQPTRVGLAFAYILETVQCDKEAMDFVRFAKKNNFKENIIEQNLSTVEKWLQSDLLLDRTGKEFDSAQIYSKYEGWCDVEGEESLSKQCFLNKLGTLKNKPGTGVKKRAINGQKKYSFTTPTQPDFEKFNDSVREFEQFLDEQITIPEPDKEDIIDFSKVKPIEIMRAALKQQENKRDSYED